MPLRIRRHCAGSNLPFKLFAYRRQLVYGGRLSPHHFNILSLLFYFVLAKRQRADSNSPFKLFAYRYGLCTAGGSRRTLLTFSVCRKTSIVRYQKWGLGRSPKQGEGGSPTLSPFPRGRGLGIGIENSHYFIKKQTFSTS